MTTVSKTTELKKAATTEAAQPTAATVTAPATVALKNPRVPLESIVEGDNARVDFSGEAELIESIDKHGLEKPLIVYSDKKGEWVVWDGHRRLRALQAITKSGDWVFDEGIEVVIRETPTKEEQLLGQLINNDGKPLTQLEQASIYSKLEKLGWAVAKIASHVGKTPQAVRDCNTLATATQATLNAINSGFISATNVISVLRKEGDPKKAEAKVLELVAGDTKTTKKGDKKVTGKAVKEATGKVKKEAAGVGTMRDRLNQCYELLVLNEKKPKYSEADVIGLLQFIENGVGVLGKILEGTAKK